MQAQLSCPLSYHIIVSKTLPQALRFFHQGMELRIETIDGPEHDVRMQNRTTEPMDASQQFCPNLACTARGQIGQGTIRIHDRKRQRYRCTMCKQTFSARRGTMLEGLRKPTELIVIVVTLLAYGCPIQAVVHAYGVDERKVESLARSSRATLSAAPSRRS